MDRADVWVAWSGGGAGRGDFLRAHFPRVGAVLLDFSHVSESLSERATAVPPTDEGAAGEQTTAWCRLSREEGGVVRLSVRECREWPARAGLSAVRAEVFGDLRNQMPRMDSPMSEANGWDIGSGAVESGCKTGVGARLTGAGMRWNEAGSHAVCHAQALSRSESRQWTACGRRSLAA